MACAYNFPTNSVSFYEFVSTNSFNEVTITNSFYTRIHICEFVNFSSEVGRNLHIFVLIDFCEISLTLRMACTLSMLGWCSGFTRCYKVTEVQHGQGEVVSWMGEWYM